MQRYKKSSISRGNVPFLGRFPRLIDTFLLIAEDFLLTKLQVGGPVEYEKQLEQLLQLVTTYTLRVSQSCCMVNNKIQRFALDIPADCPCEALFIVVSLAATFGQNGPRRGDVPAKRCLKLFKLFSYMSTCQSPRKHYCKSCSSCFPYSAGRIGKQLKRPYHSNIG